MEFEIQVLELNYSTYGLTDLLLDKETIGSRWVYKIKHYLDGSIERYT